MAEAQSSRRLAAAALVGGLCVGIAGMSAVVGSDYWPNDIIEGTSYSLRSDLDLLQSASRSELAVAVAGGDAAPTPNDVPVRKSDPLAAVEVQSPVRLIIRSIGVDTRISAVGLEPAPTQDSSPGASEKTTVAVPGIDEAGWYKFGSSPGQPGATVLAGHVDLSGRQGVFWSLEELEPQALIEVHMSDGSIVKYRVMRGTDFSRDALPSEELFRQSGAPALHLITCGGAFNQNLGRYESNYVVTAAPIYDSA